MRVKVERVKYADPSLPDADGSLKEIEYALDDVRFLKQMRDKLGARLESLGRIAWMDADRIIRASGLWEAYDGNIISLLRRFGPTRSCMIAATLRSAYTV